MGKVSYTEQADLDGIWDREKRIHFMIADDNRDLMRSNLRLAKTNQQIAKASLKLAEKNKETNQVLFLATIVIALSGLIASYPIILDVDFPLNDVAIDWVFGSLFIISVMLVIILFIIAIVKVVTADKKENE